MESKIEKLERVKPMALMGMMGEVAPQWVAKELNRIIDHLNSQAQPEIFKEFSDKNIKDDIPEGFVEINGKLHKMEDTPEEKEELTKEEWFMLKLAVNEIHNKGNGAYDEISRKIDRLSKLNKEEK